MRKIIPVLVLAAGIICLLTACGQPSAKSTTAATLSTTTVASTPEKQEIIQLDAKGYYDLFNGKTVAVVYQNKSEETLQKAVESFFKKNYDIDFNGNIVYVDSLTDGLLMLRSHKAAALQVMRFTGRYLVQRNDDLQMYGNEMISFSTNMIFNPGKSVQVGRVNTAIKAMQEDGTLDKLIEQWITSLPIGEEPTGGAMPVIDEGGEIIKMGISGDAPPLDYIAADGTPGGFNVAVLSEIGWRANINIKLITVNGGSRFAALQSGKIDSFLWHTSSKIFADAAVDSTTSESSGFIKSDSYIESKGALLVLK